MDNLIKQLVTTGTATLKLSSNLTIEELLKKLEEVSKLEVTTEQKKLRKCNGTEETVYILTVIKKEKVK